jgi:SAM-dependent methyltransferase
MERMLAATAAAEDVHFWFRGLRRNARLMLNQAGVRPGLSLILDCGAGTGRNLDWLSEFGPAFGVDLTPLALELGRQRGRRLARGSVTALPFPSAVADLVTSFDVLYCMDDENEALTLSEMLRVLKPGGVALINSAALAFLRGSHSTLSSERRRYTPDRLRTSLRTAGFEVERVTFTNCVLFPPVLAVRSLQRLTGRAAEPSDADLAVPPAPVNTFVDICLGLESQLLAIANMPIGTSVMAIARRPG